MSEGKVKIFRLNYKGYFEEISSTQDNINYFTLVDILAVYNQIRKILWIWIGKKATQSLRNFIPEIRTRFSEKLPDLKILRNITVESGQESSEFFHFFNFTWEQLNTHLKEQDNKLRPFLNELDTLKNELTKVVDEENYEEGVKVSNKIIELAKQINDKALESEQEDFSLELNEKIKFKINKKQIEEDTNELKKKFDDCIKINKSEDVIEAHKLITEFKQKYEKVFDLTTITSSNELIKRENELWYNFTKDQKAIIKDLEKFEQKLQQAISKNHLLEADEIMTKSKNSLLQISSEEIKKNWSEIENNFLEWKRKNETIFKIEKSIEESKKLKESYQFEEAISKIDSTLEIIQDKDILEYGNQLKEIRKELVKAEEDYIKLREKIAVLEERIKDNRKHNHLNAAKINCENLIKIADLIKKHDILFKYNQILGEIEQEAETTDLEVKNELNILNERVKEIETVIDVDKENVLPLIEEFSVSDIIGNLSSDVNEMLEQVSNILNEHRVEVREEITNRTIITSSSGEIMEMENKFEVQKKEGDNKEITFNARSGFENPFNDVIEEAVVNDLIPFNYEIMEVQLNGKVVDELPNKTPIKEGLEIKWQIIDIQPEEKIEINYNLRKRVSRTIIFILKNNVKIIKTHSNMNKLNIEGLFEANLAFSNSYKDTLSGVIVEDIIPIYYLHIIKEPANLFPAEIKRADQGDLVKWNIGIMKEITINYQYRLLELYKFEEIKVIINELSKKGMDNLNKGDLTDGLNIYDKIINTLEEFNK